MNQPSSNIFKRWLAVLSLVVGAVLGVHAAGVEIGGLYYELNSTSKTATVTYENTSSSNYASLPADVVIPSTVVYNNATYTVTSIANKAFANCTALESVSIPGTVTSVGKVYEESFYGDMSSPSCGSDLPFYGCSSLKLVRFEDAETQLSLGAVFNITNVSYTEYQGLGLFSSCPLEEVYLGRNITYPTYSSYPYVTKPYRYGYSAFYRQKNLSKVTIGPKVSQLHDYIFYGCENLTSVTLGESLVSIPKYSFTGAKIESLNIPNSVLSIGNYAFNNAGINNISFGSSLSTIGNYAFSDTKISKAILPTNLSSMGEYCFANCTNLTEFEVGGNCATLPKGILKGCTKLASIKLNDGLTTISDQAFANCSALEYISIPGTVTTLGTTVSIGDRYNLYSSSGTELPFYACSSLKTVRFEDGASDLSLGVIFNSYYLDNSSTNVGLGLFNLCPLEEVYLGRNIVYDEYSSKYTVSSYPSLYGYSAFYNQSKLAKITIGNSVTTLQPYMFDGCNNLVYLDLGNSIEAIPNYSFRNCKVDNIVIPSTVKAIGNYAFYNNTKLSSLSLGESTISIGSNAFCDCSSLSNVEWNIVLNSIGSYCFNGTSLSNVSLPASIHSIGEYCFANCTNLTEFEVGGNCATLPKGMLKGCTKLASIKLNDGLTTISDQAFANCSALEYISIPGTVTTLGTTVSIAERYSLNSSSGTELPFYACSSLKTVRFEDGASDLSLGVIFNSYYLDNSSTNVGLGLFNLCPLEEVYLGRNIVYDEYSSKYTVSSYPSLYGYSAFYNQPKLAKVTIGGYCSSIPSYLFYSNPIITLMDLPNVKSIGKAAFRNCTKLTTLNLGSSLETIGDEAFYGCSNVTKLTLPETSTSIGASAFYNCSSVTEVTVGKSLKSIGASAFYNCPSFTAIILPDGFTTLGASAFEKCTKLTVAKLGESLTSVPAYAFKDCPALSEMVLPSTVMSIGDQAFYNDSGLATITMKEGLKTIGNAVFWNNSGIMRFTIPGTVTSIGANCFYGCTKTTYLIFSNGEEELTINNISCRSSIIDEIVERTINSYNQDTYKNRAYDYFYDCPIRFLTLGRNLKYQYTNSTSLYDLSGTSSFTNVQRASAPFVNNTNLISVTIGPNVTYLYDHLFDGCTNIKTVNMGENVKNIKTYAFKNCDALTKILFSQKLETVGDYAFYNCDILGNANFPSTLKSLGAYSFYNCFTLSDVTFTESTSTKLTIGNYAFKDCNGITTLTFPGQLNYIGQHAFRTCENLESTLFNDSKLSENDLTIDQYAFSSCEKLSNVHYPSHLYKINSYAYSGCRSIPTLSFPSHLVSLGNYVFSYNNSLTDVTFEGGSDLLEIGYGASDRSDYGLFRDCPLESLNLNRWLSYNTDVASRSPFYGISTLKNITFGNNVKVIDKYMFSYCTGLEELYLPDNIESVGLWGFRGCTSLKTVRFSEKLSQVSDYGFSGCTSLDNVVFPASMTSIADNSFSNCTSLKKLNLGDKLMIIGPSAFKNDTALEGVELPKSLYGLGVEAFANCTSLPFVKIQGISSVGKQAFQGCSGMKWVSLSEETTSLGEDSFADCTGINYIKSYAEFPPEGLVNFPTEVVAKGTLFVPEYSVDYYQYSPTWEDWYSIRPLNENILVSSIELNNTEVSFKATQTVQLTATVDDDVTDKTIFWSSDNENVVTVDADGLITAIAVGEANVTALAADGSGETATCVVTVVPTMVESIAINPGVTSLKKGRTLELSAEVLPATATNSNVAWSSSNASIASVNANGVITALTAGNVEIVATAEDGSGVSKTFALTIIPPTKGDSNDNDVVTISDAVNTANYAVGNEVENFNVEAADVNDDNRVTLSDASATIAIVLDQPVQAPSMAKVRALASSTIDESDLLVIDDYSAKPGETTSVFVAHDNTLDYVALQADVTVPEGMTLAAVNIGNRAEANHSLAVKRIDDRTMRIALFDINNSTFADNNEAILELIVKVNGTTADRIEINNILASDAQAHEYVLTSIGGNNADMSGIDNVGYSNIRIETTADGINIYNAEGYEVAIYAVDGTTLAHFVASSDFESRKVVPGVYVVAAGNKVEKVMVK